MESITLNAYAKINLGLDIVNRLPNGYHTVDMVMNQVELHDTVTIKKADTGFFMDMVIESDNSQTLDLPCDDSNLCIKAAKAILEYSNVNSGANIHLTKRIPVSAGMAGGSTDAAAVLTGLNELYNLQLTNNQLCDIAVKIGADVPYCIVGGTMRAQGIGEELTPLTPFAPIDILIAKPPVGVNTKIAYSQFDSIDNPYHPDIQSLVNSINSQKSITDLTSRMGNSFEQFIIPERPEIDQLKHIMNTNGALFSLMTGSGPTVIGFFNDKEALNNAFFAVKDSNLAADIVISRTK